MILCNVVAIAVGKATISIPTKVPNFPTPPSSAEWATLLCLAPPAWATSSALVPSRDWPPAAFSKTIRFS